MRSGIPVAIRDAVRVRDGAHCRRCGRSILDFPASIHHRLPRSRGGVPSMSNLVILCGTGVTGCHGEVESRRADAYRDGWLLQTGAAPASAAMLTVDGAWLWLDDDGTVSVDEDTKPWSAP